MPIIPQSPDRPPNRAVRVFHTWQLNNPAIEFHHEAWHYNTGGLVDEREFFAPQTEERFPNEYFQYKGNLYLRRHQIFWNPRQKHWIFYPHNNRKEQFRFVLDFFFQDPITVGLPKNALPEKEYDEWLQEQSRKASALQSPEPTPLRGVTPLKQLELPLPPVTETSKKKKGRISARESDQEDNGEEEQIEYVDAPEVVPETTGNQSSEQTSNQEQFLPPQAQEP